MFVYVLEEGSYTEAGIVGVYASFELAQNTAKGEFGHDVEAVPSTTQGYKTDGLKRWENDEHDLVITEFEVK